MKRLTREQYFIKIAEIVAERSTCERLKVGAVLVDVETNRIVATGYNGGISGAPHCIDVGCLKVEGHCIRTVHAEMNAVLHLEHNYRHLVLFVTHQPCLNCLKALVTANVQEIYFIKEYKDEARDLFIRDIGLFAPRMTKL